MSPVPGPGGVGWYHQGTAAREQPARPEHVDVQTGHCDRCGQVMYRSADDCWHPWTITRPCPEEPSTVPWDAAGWAAFRAAGLASHRPGREHFVPDDERK